MNLPVQKYRLKPVKPVEVEAYRVIDLITAMQEDYRGLPVEVQALYRLGLIQIFDGELVVETAAGQVSSSDATALLVIHPEGPPSLISATKFYPAYEKVPAA